MLVNLKKELVAWRHERYMGLVLHGAADCGKSRYIRQLMNIATGELAIFYFDIMEVVGGFEDKGIILEWNPRIFMDWLLTELQGHNKAAQWTVVVDHFDFLFNLWDHIKKKEFIQRVSHIEKAVFDSPILFVLQDDAVIEQIKQKPELGRKQFIISYNELEAI